MAGQKAAKSKRRGRRGGGGDDDDDDMDREEADELARRLAEMEALLERAMNGRTRNLFRGDDMLLVPTLVALLDVLR